MTDTEYMSIAIKRFDRLQMILRMRYESLQFHLITARDNPDFNSIGIFNLVNQSYCKSIVEEAKKIIELYNDDGTPKEISADETTNTNTKGEIPADTVFTAAQRKAIEEIVDNRLVTITTAVINGDISATGIYEKCETIPPNAPRWLLLRWLYLNEQSMKEKERKD